MIIDEPYRSDQIKRWIGGQRYIGDQMTDGVVTHSVTQGRVELTDGHEVDAWSVMSIGKIGAYTRWESRRDGRKQATKTDPINYKDILDRDGMWCYICEKDILPHHELAFDHLIPLKPRKGDPQGTHTPENIHPTHKTCNLRKSNKRFETMTSFDRRGAE